MNVKNRASVLWAILMASLRDGQAQRLSLHKAAAQGQTAPLKVAINGRFDAYNDEWVKPDVNGRNKKGQIALHLALCNPRLLQTGEKAAIESLLKGGADPNVKDAKGETALHVVSRMCDNELQFARGAVGIAKLLLSHGADPNAASVEANLTPLHVAAERGHLRLAELLLRRGASVDAPDASGATPLLHAARSSKSKMAHMLLQHGADSQIADSAGSRPRDAVEGGKDSFASAIRTHLDRERQIRTEFLEEETKKAKAKADKKAIPKDEKAEL